MLCQLGLTQRDVHAGRARPFLPANVCGPVICANMHDAESNANTPPCPSKPPAHLGLPVADRRHHPLLQVGPLDPAPVAQYSARHLCRAGLLPGHLLRQGRWPEQGLAECRGGHGGVGCVAECRGGRGGVGCAGGEVRVGCGCTTMGEGGKGAAGDPHAGRMRSVVPRGVYFRSCGCRARSRSPWRRAALCSPTSHFVFTQVPAGTLLRALPCDKQAMQHGPTNHKRLEWGPRH